MKTSSLVHRKKNLVQNRIKAGSTVFSYDSLWIAHIIGDHNGNLQVIV